MRKTNLFLIAVVLFSIGNLAYAGGVQNYILDLATQISGTLAEIHGGTARTAAMSAGSIVFKGTAAYEEDNANLYWDNSLNRLGIGTNAPAGALSVGAASQFSIGSTGTITAGLWNGTVIGTSFGGTGLTTLGSSGQYLAVGTTGSSFVFATPPAYYGSIYYDSVASPIVVTTTAAGTYYLLGSTATQSLSSGGLSRTTTNVADGHGEVTIGTGAGGQYNVSYSLSYSTDTNSQLNTGYIYVGTTAQTSCTSQTKVLQASSVLTSGNRCQLSLADGDNVSFRLTSDNAGGKLNVVKFNLSLNRIGN